MFTGIVTHTGKLKEKKHAFYTFTTDKAFCARLEKGTSVSVNGACLTVVDLPDGNSFSVEVMPESQKRTMLGSLEKHDLVNLELPVTVETFLSGHIVQGHVDATGNIAAINTDGISRIITITVPEQLRKFIVEKGSIAVNGISLTVINTNDTSFTVGIVPFTWEHTMLHKLQIGDSVNIETDILARYAERLLTKEVTK